MKLDRGLPVPDRVFAPITIWFDANNSTRCSCVPRWLAGLPTTFIVHGKQQGSHNSQMFKVGLRFVAAHETMVVSDALILTPSIFSI